MNAVNNITINRVKSNYELYFIMTKITTYTINEISFSYLTQDILDGDGAPTVGPWNMPSLHCRLVYKIYNLEL